MTGRRRQRGVAVITALLIVALVATLTYGLEWDNALELRRTTVMLHRDQAIQVALGAESWIESLLRQDLEESDSDHLGELWASDLPPLPIDGGELFGSIEDLQGRFNLNNLVDAQGEVDQASLEQFQRLLAALGIDPRFAGLTADWIDANQDPSFPNGAEDSIYTGMTPPYRAANQILSTASEIAALEGIDKATIDTLLPHVTALPSRTAINVNTATAPVLQSLDENLTSADVERLLAERAETGFTDIGNSFSSLVTPEVLNQLEDSSSYFQLRVVVRIDTVRITYFSVLERGPRGDVSPILRTLGTT